jgi:hypothetical protein
MANSPRTREFYRPIVEDLHEAARDWRTSLSRLLPLEILMTVVLLMAGLVLLSVLLHYVVSQNPQIQNAPPASATPDPLTSLTVRGARFGRDAQGNVTQATLAGSQFSDRDMRPLSTIQTLESVTLIDADVTDDGLMSLRLPRLKHLELINTKVTGEAAEAYLRMIGPPTVKVRLIRQSGEEDDN